MSSFKHLRLIEYIQLRELEFIGGTLEPLRLRNKVAGFITALDDAGLIREYIHKVERALTDYQVFHSQVKRESL
jgi:hypothetical protein